MFHYLLVPYCKAISLIRFESEKRGSKLVWYSSKTMSTSLCWVKPQSLWVNLEYCGLQRWQGWWQCCSGTWWGLRWCWKQDRGQEEHDDDREGLDLMLCFVFCHIIIWYKQVLGSTGTKPDHLYTCALILKQKSWETDSFRDGHMVISWSNPLDDPHKGRIWWNCEKLVEKIMGFGICICLFVHAS